MDRLNLERGEYSHVSNMSKCSECGRKFLKIILLRIEGKLYCQNCRDKKLEEEEYWEIK